MLCNAKRGKGLWISIMKVTEAVKVYNHGPPTLSIASIGPSAMWE